MAACNGGGGGGGPEHHAFSLRGGTGSAGLGGSGGHVYVNGVSAIRVLQDGELPELPTWSAIEPDLGSNPRTISADATLNALPILGDDGATVATGLWVKKGATLTVQVPLGFTRGLRVDGTLAAGKPPGSLDSFSPSITAETVAVSGTIDARGGDASPGTDGGTGGFISISTREAFLTGSVLATGGRGDKGGNGGSLVVSGVGNPYGPGVTPATLALTGLVDVSGGEGTSGVGGDAGISIRQGAGAAACNMFMAGELRGRGGNGTAGGGLGGNAQTTGCEVGAVVHTGTTDVSGGSATVDGEGRSCTVVSLQALNGRLYVGGTLVTAGGDGAGADFGNTGKRGCSINFATSNTSLVSDPLLDIYVAAAIEGAGGDGTEGGDGSTVSVNVTGANAPTELLLAGYPAMDLSGGGGTSTAGPGGTVDFTTREILTSGGYVLGEVRTDAAITAVGGEGSGGEGGGGGHVTLGTVLSDPAHTPISMDGVQTISAGAIDVRGGKGTTKGGQGGTFYLGDAQAASSTSSVNVSGGEGGTDLGGHGGFVSSSNTHASYTMSGTILALGGASASAGGGAGGTVEVEGTTVQFAAATCDGGASTSAGGGGGGHVVLSSSTPPTTITGTISVRPGAGTPAASVGTLDRDGASVTLTDGQYRP